MAERAKVVPVKERRFSTTERRPSTDEGWATPALEGAVSFEAPPAPPSPPPAAAASSSSAPPPADATRKKIDTADLLRRASFAEGVDLSRKRCRHAAQYVRDKAHERPLERAPLVQQAG